MFEKVLTSIGIDSLKINTLVKTKQVHNEGLLEGRVIIESGISEQFINNIELSLFERYTNPDKYSQFNILENQLRKYTLHVDKNIEEHSKDIENFVFNLSKFEFKSNSNELILKTHVYISHSVDAYDEDVIGLIY